MSDLSLLLGTTTPLLALASVLGIAWARSQDNQKRRRADRLQHRLKAELDALLAQGERTRLRIVLFVELYCGGKPAKREELTQGCNDLLAYVESLQVELQAQSIRLQHLRRRELRDGFTRIAAIANQCQDLARDFDELDRFWTGELSGMTGARPSEVKRLRSREAALS